MYNINSTQTLMPILDFRMFQHVPGPLPTIWKQKPCLKNAAYNNFNLTKHCSTLLVSLDMELGSINNCLPTSLINLVLLHYSSPIPYPVWQTNQKLHA